MISVVTQSASVVLSPALHGALQMASKGFPVFPLHGIVAGECTCGGVNVNPLCKPGKHPHFLGSMNTATIDPATIHMWFMKNPDLNYGVRLGRAMADTHKMPIVVDVDNYKPCGAEALEALEAIHGRLPETAEVLTGAGGSHRYYWAECSLSFAATMGKNIDLKVNGYVVGPGSLHASGQRYEWEASSDLFDGQEIADLPEWVAVKFSKAKRHEQMSVPAIDVPLSAATLLDIQCALMYIGADDYNDWIKVLMALKSTGAGEQAYSIADAWSSRSSKYVAEGTRQKWQQIKQDGEITLGTLIDMGRKAEKEELKEVDLTRLLARLKGPMAWPEPEPLTQETKATPYPIEALPPIIANAVIEVQRFVQAPMAMVACSAMATVAAACQARNDVERARGLVGPISLYTLTVADSGERKSTLDGHFSKPLQDYEKQCALAAETELKKYAADLAFWTATKKGLEQAATKKAEGFDKKPDNAKDVCQRLRDHEIQKPTAPVIPRLIYRDATPEALLHGIAKEWPSVALMSSEGGIVFGGHGMSKESQMRNLATINELWDGKPVRTDRRAAEGSYNADGRMTVAIQVQAPTLKAFFDSSGQLARGTGFLARFLIAWPESTQGTRRFNEAPEQWPMLECYRARITHLLNLPQQVEHGRVNPSKLSLSDAGKQVWIAFHDEIEDQLGEDGELHDVRDVASKIADNAARLAALFHVMQDCDGAISSTNVTNACHIARWHLNESRRLLNAPATQAESDAQVIDRWLIKKCKEKAVTAIPFGDMQRGVRKDLRPKDRLDPVLSTLSGLKRVKVSEGTPRMVHVNPSLMSDDLD